MKHPHQHKLRLEGYGVVTRSRIVEYFVYCPYCDASASTHDAVNKREADAIFRNDHGWSRDATGLLVCSTCAGQAHCSKCGTNLTDGDHASDRCSADPSGSHNPV